MYSSTHILMVAALSGIGFYNVQAGEGLMKNIGSGLHGFSTKDDIQNTIGSANSPEINLTSLKDSTFYEHAHQKMAKRRKISLLQPTVSIFLNNFSYHMQPYLRLSTPQVSHQLMGHLSEMEKNLIEVYLEGESESNMGRQSLKIFGEFFPEAQSPGEIFINEWEHIWDKLTLIELPSPKPDAFVQLEEVMVQFLNDSVKYKIISISKIKAFLGNKRGKALILNFVNRKFLEGETIEDFLLKLDLKLSILESSSTFYYQPILRVLDNEFWEMLNFNYLCGIVKKYPWSLHGRIKEVFKIMEGSSNFGEKSRIKMTD
ncbi:hypothetical protein PGTUg99_031102 [Puccinia graminis f. sp. tritici]|uniref:Uncharacterized protein n=1 Tax=Puccinia graminis f. sp. tritici TaxID=56615 RepID=A0A5B0NIP2_PUCGR|nr:hypothetical protein PGTUg99_031102 [Puccinia graminis f. sp. tritici]